MPTFRYKTIVDDADLPAICRKIESAALIGIDIETQGFDPRQGEIRLVQLNLDGDCYVVDLFLINNKELLITALKRAKGIFIGQQLKFETKWLWFKHKIEFGRIFDTWRADCIISNGLPNIAHDLYSIWERYLGVKPESPDLQKSDWGEHLTPSHYDYAAEDVVHLLRLREVMKPILARDGLNKVAEIEFGVIQAEAEVELNGFPFDKEAWLSLANIHRMERDRLKETLLKDLPSPTNQMLFPGFPNDLNLDSPEQVLGSFRKLGLTSKVKDDTGKVSTVPLVDTAEMTLVQHIKRFPVIKTFLDYRDFAQRVKTFGPEYIKYVNPRTERIHADSFPFTSAGRYSFRDPNLQQIPRLAQFRACFKASRGKKFVLCDYSAIEMRLIAQIAQDRNMIGVFQRGEDIHSATAALIAGKSISEVTKPERQNSKPLNFGTSYGLQAAKLVLYALALYGVTMTEREAAEFRRKWLEVYNGIDAWQKTTLRDGLRTHVSRTMSGRIRYMKPDAYNEYYSTPVSGTGADGLKRALRIVNKKLRNYNGRANIVHHVHDEIICEVDDDLELTKAVEIDVAEGMREGMAPFLPDIPCVVEPKTASSWAEK